MDWPRATCTLAYLASRVSKERFFKSLPLLFAPTTLLALFGVHGPLIAKGTTCNLLSRLLLYQSCQLRRYLWKAKACVAPCPLQYLNCVPSCMPDVVYTANNTEFVLHARMKDG